MDKPLAFLFVCS